MSKMKKNQWIAIVIVVIVVLMLLDTSVTSVFYRAMGIGNSVAGTVFFVLGSMWLFNQLTKGD